jgi:DNA-binding PadR family transcriptional regulator
VHYILQEYLEKGIIKVIREETTARIYRKKYYQLTETGVLLLELAEMLEKR